MKKRVFFAISFLLGLFICYQGFDILTFPARGESIYRLGLLIPANDTQLNLYGGLFLLIGVLFIVAPVMFRKKMIAD
ncbi:hypothetical protein [Paenibacillus assamensis]|uniref:hypothetical protein n=1 Tax=Paenibacillus assamensis TaxID=311244 RepID=UPI00048B2E8A|nr:hypothetical protein [Paenibacillus assamensis]